MEVSPLQGLEFTEEDLDFVVGEAAPAARNKPELKRLLREDEHFRTALVGDERVFQRVMADEEAFLKLSPALFFEVLLRHAFQEMELTTYTVERDGRQSIPVFDTGEVVDLLSRPGVLPYLARMLASFTRVRSYVQPVRIRPGRWRRVHYNDMDIDSLMRLCATADEEHRFGLYRRIADVCLFVTGLFPDYARLDHRYPDSGQLRPMAAGRLRRGPEEYEREGQRFYSLAEEHPTAGLLRLSEVFGLLRRHFATARKPLTFIAAHYLHSRGQRLFGLQAP